MLAYSKSDLDALPIVQQAKIWKKNLLISDSAYAAIELKYSHKLYSPAVFIRIGLYIFSSIFISAAHGFFMLITGTFDSYENETKLAILLIVLGIITIGALELLIKEKKIFRAGIDDALLYSGVSVLIIGLCMLATPSDDSYQSNYILRYCFLALPILVIAAIRYADSIAALSAFGTFLCILYLCIEKMGESILPLLPFIGMAISLPSYLCFKKLKQNESHRYWNLPLSLLEITSLLLLYISGNYFVVRTLSQELLNVYLEEGQDISFAFLFYFYTAAIPLAYLFFGLKNKNRILLQTGLLLVAVSVLTFKYYFSLGHHEISLTIAGLLMLAVAWGTIVLLKKPKAGITYLEDSLENTEGNTTMEAITIAQTFSNNQKGQENSDTNFGGGKFGGGGGDGSF